jgi:hypothetical protein
MVWKEGEISSFVRYRVTLALPVPPDPLLTYTFTHRPSHSTHVERLAQVGQASLSAKPPMPPWALGLATPISSM